MPWVEIKAQWRCCFAGSGRVNGRNFTECQDWGPPCLWGMCGDCIQGSLRIDGGSGPGESQSPLHPFFPTCALGHSTDPLRIPAPAPQTLIQKPWESWWLWVGGTYVQTSSQYSPAGVGRTVSPHEHCRCSMQRSPQTAQAHLLLASSWHSQREPKAAVFSGSVLLGTKCYLVVFGVLVCLFSVISL